MHLAYNFDELRRGSDRKRYTKEVIFSAGTMVFPAFVENISLGGALLTTKRLPTMKPGIKITVSIPFAGKEGCLKRKAMIMWAGHDKFGIQFI